MENRTKEQIVTAIRQLLGITQPGILASWEFEAMCKRSLVTLYDALCEVRA